jgi:hypothetical protein
MNGNAARRRDRGRYFGAACPLCRRGSGAVRNIDGGTAHSAPCFTPPAPLDGRLSQYTKRLTTHSALSTLREHRGGRQTSEWHSNHPRFKRAIEETLTHRPSLTAPHSMTPSAGPAAFDASTSGLTPVDVRRGWTLPARRSQRGFVRQLWPFLFQNLLDACVPFGGMWDAAYGRDRGRAELLAPATQRNAHWLLPSQHSVVEIDPVPGKIGAQST